MFPIFFLVSGIVAVFVASNTESPPIDKTEIWQEIESLKMELSWYEKHQEFELCAQVRDEIKELTAFYESI